MARPRRKLRTVGHVTTELGRQYRLAEAGKLSWVDAYYIARILRELRAMMEAGELEQRIASLEAALAAHRRAGPSPPLLRNRSAPLAGNGHRPSKEPLM
jgi:hypothetical protein